jgi:hypothetical protein
MSKLLSWTDPQLQKVLKEICEQEGLSAETMAKELFDRGVNFAVDPREYDAPDEVVLPREWLERVQMLLLLKPSLRKRSGPGRPPKLSTEQLKELARTVRSKRKAAAIMAARTGEKTETLRRRLRPKRSKGGRN